MNTTMVPSPLVDDTLNVGTVGAGGQEQVAAPEALSLSVGRQFRAAREAKGMSVSDVARALKMSARQIEAMEADDWSSLPGKTIIRGFVRNEARLLGLKPDLLMSGLDKLEMPKTPELEVKPGAPVSIPGENTADRRDYVRVFSGLIILCLAIAAFFLLPQDWWQSTISAFNALSQSNEVVAESSSETKEVPAPSESPVVAEVNPAGVAESEAGVPPPEMPVVAELPSMADAGAQLQPLAPAATGNVLKFSFTKPAWVEVRDRDGQVIFSRLNQAGSQQEIAGQPPFALIVGNATYVTLEYKGKPVELGNRSKDDVSRLSLE